MHIRKGKIMIKYSTKYYFRWTVNGISQNYFYFRSEKSFQQQIQTLNKFKQTEEDDIEL